MHLQRGFEPSLPARAASSARVSFLNFLIGLVCESQSALLPQAQVESEGIPYRRWVESGISISKGPRRSLAGIVISDERCSMKGPSDLLKHTCEGRDCIEVLTGLELGEPSAVHFIHCDAGDDECAEGMASTRWPKGGDAKPNLRRGRSMVRPGGFLLSWHVCFL